MQYLAARACRAIGRPYVFTPHGMLDSWSLRQRWAKKRLYRWLRLDRELRGAAAFHTTSDAERREVEALGLGPRVIVEPLGIDMAEFEALPPRGTFRARYPQIGDRPLVVFLGRVHPGKGVEYLIPALGATRVRDVVLAVVGPDSKGYLAEMRKLADTHGVAERVLFTGMAVGAERIPPLVDADLFALPSDHENFGVSAVEALAARDAGVDLEPGEHFRRASRGGRGAGRRARSGGHCGPGRPVDWRGSGAAGGGRGAVPAFRARAVRLVVDRPAVVGALPGAGGGAPNAAPVDSGASQHRSSFVF